MSSPLRPAAMTPRPLIVALQAIGITALSAGGVLAQTTQAPGVMELSNIVVTASGYEQDIKDAPASISIITGEELRKQPFSNLQDAIRHTEGLSIVGSDAAGKDIAIRGMPADYTVIMVDGQRRNSRETRTRGGSSGLQSQLIPPLDAIERIEVVRGPMSSLYGADAMGGVINIITRKVPETWGGSISADTFLSQRDDRGDLSQTSFWLGGPLKTDLLGLQVYGKYSDQGEDTVWAGRPGSRDKSVTAKLTLTPTDKQEISLEAGYEEFSRIQSLGKSVRPENLVSKAGKIITKANTGTLSDDSRSHWAISHKGRWDFGETELSFAHETSKQRTLDPDTGLVSYDGGAEPKLDSSILQGLVTLPFERHVLKIGGQYEWKKLSNVDGENSSFKNGNKKNAVTPNPFGAVSEIKRKSWALFVEDAFDVTEDFTVTAGIRLDEDEYYGSHWTPRLYGVYRATPTVTVRGGVAKGFRAPTMRQVVPQYVTSTGGPTSQTGIMYGNPDLKPETSVNTELGVRYDAPSGFSASLTLFNNDIKNKISSDYTGGDDPVTGAPLYQYLNIDEVRIRGIETSLTWPVTDAVKLTANYTYTDSKRKKGSETTFLGESLDGYALDKTPEHMANVRVDWQVNEKLATWGRANYEGKSYWAAYRNGPSSHIRERKGLTTFDLGLAYNVSNNVTVNAAVVNVANKVLDVDYAPICGAAEAGCGPSGNWMADPGRQIWLGMNVRF
ncbi:TonB-dependent receptor domain-containing protein [Paracandidimonas soli]|uniref:Outer membrane receptor for ferrienterochelin and colicins n=1 Tax=Paracandidimonas soli TaxID=1917182 RepID=A0A4R3UPX8_9BURK|nr:TonB-dependent receptor [Paracandidimonas soli]TCU93846.1 outer membrane receptor for ferrienterochelin and colicins [Paracandidimonas soli]